MNIKRMVAFALVGATAITGCVSIQSLDQDLKSKDAAREASATEKMSKIITNGKVNFVSFNESDRLWCAKNLKDKKTILETIESMSHVQHWDPLNTSREEMYILLGMKHGVNAPILEALLDNLGVNQSAIDILMRKDIEYASQVCQVTIKYINVYVKSINDMDKLIGLMDKCKNWRDVNNDGRGESSELYRELFETIIPSRMIALITGQKDLKKILNWYRSRGICADDKMLRLAIAKIKDPKELASLFSDYKEHEHKIIEGIVDPVILSEIALNFDRDMTLPGNRGMAEKIMERIDDKEMLIRIALFAKSGWMKRLAKAKVNDEKTIVDAIVRALNERKISEGDAVTVLQGEKATIALYNAVHQSVLKKQLFPQLSNEDRKIVRAGNVGKCEKMIEKAKEKSKETFEMGGFYLGMDIANVDLLVGYYFPEWSTSEDVDNDEKDIRVVYVPQQRRPFCRADKTGKVWQFNFGKSMLKKFCKYDVQDEREWARAYSKEHGIDMKHVFLNKETTVVDISGNLDVHNRKAWLHQDTWQWKNNAKGYRLVYFAEPKIEAGHNVIKQQAAYQFRFVSSEAGTLQVTVEND